MSNEVSVNIDKTRRRVFSLLRDAATKKISLELFIDTFIPIFASYGEDIFSEIEYELMDAIFQEAPYFVPIIYLHPGDHVFLDVRKFRELITGNYRKLLALGKEFSKKSSLH